MPVLVAIDLVGKSARLVAGEISPSGEINIFDVRELPLEEFTSRNGASPHGGDAAEDQADSPDEKTSEETLSEEAFPKETLGEQTETVDDVPRIDLEELIDVDIDQMLAVIPSRRVLFEKVQFPFQDPRKVEQVLPLQIQDLVPFELDGFVIDAISLGKTKNNEFEYLASLVPSEDISNTLALLKRLGADPKTLTSKASSLTALAQLCPRYLNGSYGLLLLNDQECSLALFVDDKLQHLRELPVSSNDDTFELVLKDIRCSIAQVERDYDREIDRIYTIGDSQSLRNVANQLGRPSEPLDISAFVKVAPQVDTSPNDLAWAIGLFASEIPKLKPEMLINYRKGPFAYKPTFGNFVAAFKEEWYNYAVLLIGFLAWVISLVLTSHNSLQVFDDQIRAKVAKVFPGEQVPERQEVPFIKDKLEEIEEKLRGLGSLSALSPLESLREIHQAIGQEIDVQVDSMSINRAGLRFYGSVPGNRAIGQLQGALDKRDKKFCKVSVDNKGQDRGKKRVKFSASIDFCD